MSIKERLSNDVKDAMRARDQKTLGTLRLITAAVKQVEVDERITVEDDRLLAILDKLCKQRRESIAQYRAANREDLVSQEQFELDIIARYLPAPLTDAEVDTLIAEAIAEAGATGQADMGKVMALLKPRLQGRADMGKVSPRVKALLSV
ncbi:Yqey-like protein [Legionella geestiana]|uniref:Yqey-like protein n=1 Tax=Legionella geestiana TaxID=45065 RepID=A0A0W0U7M1_9GAMM|nr:GatB/YqeY domain-containing protein [Legionella geestiana]KTD04018.1 Yqey-like protein [Legionella geestiana]QBS12875.1 GatB/YqeY domain-containing protein [Legionella geestiana]QDQ39431.1 GatB/YqeY domain-containing protein [Legionella geestiana]STX54637.1 Transamidase GatB domain protein [Legionella geestiana]